MDDDAARLAKGKGSDSSERGRGDYIRLGFSG